MGTFLDSWQTGTGLRGCGGAGVRCGLRADGDVFRLAIRLPTADSLCSLKVARASKISADGNFRRPLVGSLRALTSAEMAALICIAAARTGFLLAALHSVAKRVSRGQAYHRRGPSPFARSPHRTPAPPLPAAPFPLDSTRGMCPKGVGKIARVDVRVLLFSQQRKMRTCCAC